MQLDDDLSKTLGKVIPSTVKNGKPQVSIIKALKVYEKQKVEILSRKDIVDHRSFKYGQRS